MCSITCFTLSSLLSQGHHTATRPDDRAYPEALLRPERGRKLTSRKPPKPEYFGCIRRQIVLGRIRARIDTGVNTGKVATDGGGSSCLAPSQARPAAAKSAGRDNAKRDLWSRTPPIGRCGKPGFASWATWPGARISAFSTK